MQLIFGLLLLAAAPDLWLKRVEPVLSKDERAVYSSLLDEKAREAFRQALFAGKAITETEYFARVQHIDVAFGSGQPGSGANTDPGRLYLAIGPPTGVNRLPSSRIFYPTEIWYYDHVPGLQISGRVQFLFYRPKDVGVMKLYSSQLNTIRALIINNAGTRGLFPVNDVVNETDVRERLNLSPAEIDVLDAAMGVAKGVKNSGNSEILYLATSPREMLSRQRVGMARSRVSFNMERPKLETKQFATLNKIPAIDLTVTGTARGFVTVEIRDVESFENRLNFDAPKPVTYTQRVYLLPGDYTVLIDVDGFRTGFLLKVEKLTPSDPIATTQYPGADWAALGRQYLLLQDQPKAATCFKRALAAARSFDALLGMARLTANLDQARDLLLEALKIQPDNYEALLAMAAVTAEFQDYPLAETYRQRAQAVKRRDPL